MNDTFLSVVAHKEIPDSLLVRSRIAGDIERAIPGVDTFEDPEADYRYRAVVGREEFKTAIAARIDGIDYPNFKNSIRDARKHHAATGIWALLAKTFGAFGSPGEDDA